MFAGQSRHVLFPQVYGELPGAHHAHQYTNFPGFSQFLAGELPIFSHVLMDNSRVNTGKVDQDDRSLQLLWIWDTTQAEPAGTNEVGSHPNTGISLISPWKILGNHGKTMGIYGMN